MYYERAGSGHDLITLQKQKDGAKIDGIGNFTRAAPKNIRIAFPLVERNNAWNVAVFCAS
ncbi:hypothetical protein BZM26_30655 [Paraburkholderia strydomiana]|nr:hypothetical protein BZM26_30655 [Paraburkholderia strydomiana]